MSLLRSIVHHSLPSVLNDPFKKTCIKRISVWFSDGWGFRRDEWRANGTVEFANGDTSGEQKFDGATFDEVVMKIKVFIEEIESK